MNTTAPVDLLPIMSDGLHDFRNVEGSRALMQMIRQSLTNAGMPRASLYGGGEITGYTRAQGSTGFSVSYDTMGKAVFNGRQYLPGEFLNFHIVISGKRAGLSYREYEEYEDGEHLELHEPLKTSSLNPRITKVFADLGFKVLNVMCTGHQTMWDDDVSYNVYTQAV